LKTGNIGTGNTGNNSTFSYIFGNPPFLGASSDGMDAAKKADMLTLFPKNKNLDFQLPILVFMRTARQV
jgi:hypothetical protein